MFVSTNLEKNSKHNFTNKETSWNLKLNGIWKKTKLTSKLELKLEKNSISTTFAQSKRKGQHQFEEQNRTKKGAKEQRSKSNKTRKGPRINKEIF